MQNVVTFRFTVIASLAALVSLGAHAQTSEGGCSRFTTDLQEVDRTIINAQIEPRERVPKLKTALEATNRIVDGKPVPIVVELCDVELDLTRELITIGDNRALIASPDCARGPRKLGPLIFVTQRQNPLKIIGDNVMIAGFRLRGPSEEIGWGDTEAGITIKPSSGPLIRHIEICNMEIFHWSGQAIGVFDTASEQEPRGRLVNTNVGAVRIKNNFLHHNRHANRGGYGVNVGNGGYALIERNVFHENRHAIAGGSHDDKKKDFTGYTARENLILPSGGLHCSDNPLFVLTGWRFNCLQTHQIDMHGDKSHGLFGVIGGDRCCGTAGETIIIERNTILYVGGTASLLPPARHGYAIKIRGNPVDKAVVEGNLFTHSNWHDAVSQNGDLVQWCVNLPNPFGRRCFTASQDPTNPIQGRNNEFGRNPLDPFAGELGLCDFGGNGEQDQFMTTGLTWWARWLRPTEQIDQWRYLNTMTEMLPGLHFADFDGDGICDVAKEINPRRQFYSKSGRTPWMLVGSVPVEPSNEPRPEE
jgi:hypothetical protein